MKLKPIASNLTELQIASDVEFAPRIAFSYQTPVAGFDEFGAFKTDKKFSPTTSSHIKKYLGDAFDDARIVPQKMIEAMVL